MGGLFIKKTELHNYGGKFVTATRFDTNILRNRNAATLKSRSYVAYLYDLNDDIVLLHLVFLHTLHKKIELFP